MNAYPRFEIDYEARTIKFGPNTWSVFFTLKSATSFLGLGGPIWGPVFELAKQRGSKSYYKTFSEIYHVTPSQFVRTLNAIMYKVWVHPVKRWYLKYAFVRGGRIHYPLLNKIHLHRALIEQVEKDGLDHLTPLVLFTGKSVQELRKECGKSLWKTLCKNSRTRNHLIALHIEMEGNYRGDSFVEQLRSACRFPSGYLKTQNSDVDAAAWWAFNVCEGVYRGNGGLLMREADLYADTERMAAELGASFNPQWSQRKMKERHDEYAAKHRSKEFSPEPFCESKTIVLQGGYVAKLLNSPLAMADEGAAMGHCVAYYSRQCASGSYAVFSITKDGERESTLGLEKDKNRWGIQQHVTRFNGPINVSDPLALVAIDVVSRFNRNPLCEPTSTAKN